MITRWRVRGTVGFGAILVIGCFVGLLFFARPAASAVENRNLTAFPEFTVERFVDGSFFSDLSLWYADTYPLREPMVRADLSLEKLFGIQPKTSMIGGNRASDELPAEGQEGTEGEVSPKRQPRDHNISEPEVRARAANIEAQITDGVYVTDEAAYTLYYFDRDATQAYVDVINDAAKLLEGEADVYSILLPTNGGVMLDDELLSQLGVPNQDQAIDYFYSLMDDQVIVVPTFDTLYEHRDEYLYFRTDFHWTQLAAYYVYCSFCETKGISPAPYNEWEELVFQPYQGEYSTYVDISGFQPDSVVARIPQGTNTMTYWTNDLDPSTETEGPVITDLSDASSDANKYNCFVCGNRPLSHIENPNVTDGSSCLVVKDSFGNPLVSTMVDSYQHIYTIDFRFTSQKLVDLVHQYGIKDVIFENVIMFAGTYDCSDLLASIVYPNGYSMEGTEGSDSAAPEESTEGGNENESE
ncbi:DHHW family protein [Adlercreutzia sp. ZJ138]|uniref:DHHW family protein n=1 Tax=Adlercreutzia sp. ZJ138 TaxID=2709405 RepID=UPI0013EDD303|nr:DHHW family protein [Adlercreutzia sp. ZJ138]